MKKVSILLATLLLFTVSVKAQTNKEEIDILQAAFGMEKKAMVAEFVQLNPAQKDAFWKLYDEYETQRKELGKKRIELLTEYNNNFENMTNESADAWMARVLDLGKKTDALLLSTYKKVKKATNPINAIQFYQVETYILTAIRNEIMGELPFLEHK